MTKGRAILRATVTRFLLTNGPIQRDIDGWPMMQAHQEGLSDQVCFPPFLAVGA